LDLISLERLAVFARDVLFCRVCVERESKGAIEDVMNDRVGNARVCIYSCWFCGRVGVGEWALEEDNVRVCELPRWVLCKV
jgi:hypothetical protein